MPLDEVTFADEMKLAGYRTHAGFMILIFLISVGKWHLGHYCPQCLPQNRGFDTFYGYLTGAEDYYKKDSHQFLPLIGARNKPLGGTRLKHFDNDQKTFCIRIEDDQPAKCGYDFYSNADRDYKGRFSLAIQTRFLIGLVENQ